VERATLTTADGVRLAAMVQRARQPRVGVVIAHGFSASSAHRGVRELADALVDAHHDVVSYDARGHGSSGGWCTLGAQERFDVAAARRALDPSMPVILVGVSMGAIAVLRHAAAPGPGDLPDPLGVVTLSAPARWQLPRTLRGLVSAGVTSTALGRAFAARNMGVRIARRRPRGDAPVDLIARITAATAIVHAEDDPFLPSSNARMLFAAAPEPRQLDLVAGRWHALDPAAVPVVVRAVRWVDDVTTGA
jgi:pimeloyl-ACP methyl ester carboxylesterase